MYLQPIALAPTLSNVFEWCILLEFSSSFTTSPLQFGFKRGLSTDLCTGLLKNIIGRYNVHDSTVYGCFLDASKAFDRVDHSLLFDKLLKRKLSLVVARTLLAWYSQQKVSISWNSSLSDKFSITNGVRQGGVLSPILFYNIYTLMICVQTWRKWVWVATGDSTSLAHVLC